MVVTGIYLIRVRAAKFSARQITKQNALTG